MVVPYYLECKACNVDLCCPGEPETWRLVCSLRTMANRCRSSRTDRNIATCTILSRNKGNGYKEKPPKRVDSLTLTTIYIYIYKILNNNNKKKSKARRNRCLVRVIFLLNFISNAFLRRYEIFFAAKIRVKLEYRN